MKSFLFKLMMILWELYMIISLYFMSLILLVMAFKYMLVLLMMIELIVLNISVFMYMMFSVSKMEFYVIYYLVFSVCEAVLGLGLLVMIIRYYGNEMYYMFNMSKF